jgi:hypothetical protein
MSDNSSGITLGGLIGTVLAAFLSWDMWGSLVWAAVAALFGWFYVIYYALKYGFS